MMTPAHRERLLIAVLALSPLAYLGAMLMERVLPARTDVQSIGEAEALRITADFAASRGIDTHGWKSAVATDANGNEGPVARRYPGALEHLSAPTVIKVLLQGSGKDHRFRATLTPHGTVVAFQESEDKSRLENTDRQTAKSLAESFLRSWLGDNPDWKLTSQNDVDPSEIAREVKREVGKGSDSGDQDRSFTWRSPVPGVPKVTAVFHVDTYGKRVVGERCGLTVNSSLYNPYSGLVTTLKVFAWIYVVLVGLYAIVRYWRLSADREVSHHRSALAALAYALMSALFVFDPGYLAGQVGAELGANRIATSALLGVTYCFVGAFFGVAYGAGEGGLRKNFPGKLTSLDALLSGKLFSTNVARSFLIGGGIAGWLLLLQNGVLLAAHGSRAGTDYEIVASLFYRFPLFALFGDRAAESVLQTSFGLLLPLALLFPRIRKPWLFFTLMPLFAMLPATITAGDEVLWVTFFSVQLVLVAAVFLPFVSGDLLAAICGIFAVRFVGALMQRSVVSGTWEHIFLWQVAPAGVIFLLAQVYFAWRGPTYEEYEVRPRYAHFLVEHQAMEAEIDAARVAQLRLMPNAPPVIEGLSIAASCIAAREVGGDFFDFYELDSHRLGIFLAEGGSRELGSAMPIALAKGYLLYASGLDLPPAELLRRLHDAMETALQGQASMSMLYAVIDGRARTIRFARTGDSPRLSVNGNPAVEEVAGDPANPKAVHHGVAALSLKDAIVFYTDGLSAQIAERKRQWTDPFLRKVVTKHPGAGAAELLADILKAVIRGKQLPPDDVTSVVVRVEEPAVNAMGVVA